MHLTFDLYLMVLRGELPPSALVEVAHEHLLNLCSTCTAEWNAYQASDQTQLPVGSECSGRVSESRSQEAHRSVRGSAVKGTEESVRQMKCERRKARQDFSGLLSTSPGNWEARVENAQTRYRSRAFAELLLVEARQRVRSEPTVASQLAALVPVVLHWIPGIEEQAWAPSLELLARMEVANAARVQGNLVNAEELFDAIRDQLHQRPLNDPEVYARLCTLEASLRLAQRRLHQAGELLDQAILLFNLGGETRQLAGVLIQRGNLSHSLNQPAQALELLERAAGLIDPEDSPFLHLCTVTSRVLCFCDLDRAEEAWELLHRHLPSYEESDDPWVRVSVQDLRGRVLLGLGCHDEAAEAFAACRDGALELGRDYDAALASLDLALVYLEQGRTAELRELAAELVPTFQARGVGRETLAALRLFQQAVGAEELTRSLLAEVRDSLRLTAAKTV